MPYAQPPIGCTSQYTNSLIKRAMWLFLACTITIIGVLVWYGNRLQRTSELQIRLENARRVDGYMRSMLHEIHTRAAAIRSGGTLTDASGTRELEAIIDASDMAMRLRSFYVMPDGEQP